MDGSSSDSAGGSAPICGPCDHCTKDGSPAPQAQVSKYPVRYSNGELQFQVSDLGSTGFGLQWGHTRSFSNVSGSSSNRINGNNWFVAQIPVLNVNLNGNTSAFVGRAVYWFQGGDAGFNPKYPFKAQLNAQGAGPTKIYSLLTGDSGVVLTYDAQGRFRSVINAAGDEMLAQYDGVGHLTSLPLSSATVGSPNANYLYSYYDTGLPNDKISSVVYQGNGQNVRRASYNYYGLAAC